MMPNPSLNADVPHAGCALGRPAGFVRRRKLQRSFVFALTLLIAADVACSEEPEFVYVLEAQQTVSLIASASSARVFAGEPIVLHVQRRTSGVWKRIPMKSRAPDQCWMRRPPPESENEVAD